MLFGMSSGSENVYLVSVDWTGPSKYHEIQTCNQTLLLLSCPPFALLCNAANPVIFYALYSVAQKDAAKLSLLVLGFHTRISHSASFNGTSI